MRRGSAPLLQDDGAIFSDQGYDPATGMWLENLPDLTGLIPERPTFEDAAAALRLLRETFKTFTSYPLLIRMSANCLDCSCGQANEVRLCHLQHCALWPFRFGKDPNPSRRGFAVKLPVYTHDFQEEKEIGT